MSFTRRGAPTAVALMILVIGVLAVLEERCSAGRVVDVGGVAEVERAYRERRSDVWIEVQGRVDRLLSDDNEGSRHQRFIIELDGGHTLLVSHNIDLAPRVPLSLGDQVDVRGEYVWNDRGGLLHWTHHDPRGEHAGGSITHRGETYR